VSWLEPTSCDTIYSLCKNKYVYKILLYYLTLDMLNGILFVGCSQMVDSFSCNSVVLLCTCVYLEQTGIFCLCETCIVRIAYGNYL